MTHLDNSKLPMEKRGKLEKDAQIMIKMLPPQVEYERKMQQADCTTKSKDSQTDTKLNKSIIFDYNEQEGRFAKANRKVNVGEKILVEQPACAVLMEKFSKSHCQHCLAR